MLRLAILAVGTLLGVAVVAFVYARLFPAPPASQRLAGVTVTVVGFAIDGGPAAIPTSEPGGRHRLDVRVEVASPGALAECMAFTLDEPFASRRFELVNGQPGDCILPVAGSHALDLTFDRLTDNDLVFPSHTLVWGIRGGSCGLILEAVGACVVEQAGTVPVDLPRPGTLPSFPPLGSFSPIFSFEPIP